MQTSSGTCFLHIEKSGGSTLVRRIREALGPAAVFHTHEAHAVNAPLPLLLDRFPVVAGHFTYADMTSQVRDRAFLLTVLREPVDRVVSLFYFWKKSNRLQAQHQPVLDFKEFLRTQAPKGRVSPWSNWQTYVLSGATDCEQDAEELLPAALRNLETFDRVYLNDTLDADLPALAEERGWPEIASTSRINVTEGRPDLHTLDPELTATLRDMNQCDLALVARARELRELRSGNDGAAFRAPPAHCTTEALFARAESGTRDIHVVGARVRSVDAEDAEENVVGFRDRARIELEYHSTIDATDVAIGIRLTDALGVEVYGVNTVLAGQPIQVHAGETSRIAFDCDMILAPGVYRLTVAIHQSGSHLDTNYHWIDNALAFECRARGPLGFAGMVDLGAKVTVGAVH